MVVNWKAIEAYFTFYSRGIFSEIPSYMYLLLLLVTTVGVILIFSNQNVQQKWRSLGQLVFFEYVAFLLCMTVFFRESVEHRTFNLMPFWSYTAEDADLQHSLYVEALMNVLMFVPFGLLMGCAFKGIGWKRIIVASVCCSVSIEILQLVLHRGFAEIDDVIHNVLGAGLGYSFYCVFVWILGIIISSRKC